MAAAIAKADGDADYAARYWPLFAKWANYLKEKGLDPERQVVTDDFTGPLAHNANLSVKAISALGAYAQLCQMLGKKDEATSYRKVAEQYVQDWRRMAADGDHNRLAFDRPGTWSQKYNLIWDKLLRLDLFPSDVARTEIKFYPTNRMLTVCRLTPERCTPNWTGSSGQPRLRTTKPIS
jgi:glutaminase A-like protein